MKVPSRNSRAIKLWNNQIKAKANNDDIKAKLLFSELVNMFNDELSLHLFRLTKNEDDANDLSQKTWIKMWHSNTETVTYFKAFLFKAAYNNFISFLKEEIRFGKRVDIEESAIREICVNPQALEKIQAEYNARTIESFIETHFNELQKKIWPLHCRGFSNREIADQLSRSISTINNNVTVIRNFYETNSNP